MRSLLLIISVILFFSCSDELLNPSENLELVPVLELQMTQETLNNLRTNRTNDAEFNTNIFYKGQKYKGEIEASGAGSRYNPRWSYKIELIYLKIPSFYPRLIVMAGRKVSPQV